MWKKSSIGADQIFQAWQLCGKLKEMNRGVYLAVTGHEKACDRRTKRLYSNCQGHMEQGMGIVSEKIFARMFNHAECTLGLTDPDDFFFQIKLCLCCSIKLKLSVVE